MGALEDVDTEEEEHRASLRHGNAVVGRGGACGEAPAERATFRRPQTACSGAPDSRPPAIPSGTIAAPSPCCAHLVGIPPPGGKFTGQAACLASAGSWMAKPARRGPQLEPQEAMDCHQRRGGPEPACCGVAAAAVPAGAHWRAWAGRAPLCSPQTRVASPSRINEFQPCVLIDEHSTGDAAVCGWQNCGRLVCKRRWAVICTASQNGGMAEGRREARQQCTSGINAGWQYS